MADTNGPPAPDFTQGYPLRQIPDGGIVAGRVGSDDVVLVRRSDAVFAVGAHCTHYHGPLADGLVVGNTIRCPWHHACFSLETGEALRAPALDPIASWRVDRAGDLVFVRENELKRRRDGLPCARVGGHRRWRRRGLAAAEMLRREGYDGPLTMISADDSAPCDRPNLSKDYLAGTANEDWIPLRPPEFYADLESTSCSTLRCDTGRPGATGRSRRRPDLCVRRFAHCDRSRSRAVDDSRSGRLPCALPSFVRGQPRDYRAASTAKRALVIGASFIGLEVAASLRARGLDVTRGGARATAAGTCDGPGRWPIHSGLHERTA